jgi:hypothetical protein
MYYLMPGAEDRKNRVGMKRLEAALSFSYIMAWQYFNTTSMDMMLLLLRRMIAFCCISISISIDAISGPKSCTIQDNIS